MLFSPEHAFALAQRFVGLREVPGPVASPAVLAMLRLDTPYVTDDDVPWCSAFVNYVAWLCRMPRSKSLAARSWLSVGSGVLLEDARVGDVVVLKRGGHHQPGPEVTRAPGHVGFFAGWGQAGRKDLVQVLGGNQADSVSVSHFPVEQVLSIRRVA